MTESLFFKGVSATNWLDISPFVSWKLPIRYKMV